MKQQSTLMKIGDVAKVLGVTVKTLQRWHKDGKFVPDVISFGDHRYYKRERVEDILKTGIVDKRGALPAEMFLAILRHELLLRGHNPDSETVAIPGLIIAAIVLSWHKTQPLNKALADWLGTISLPHGLKIGDNEDDEPIFVWNMDGDNPLNKLKGRLDVLFIRS